LIVDNKKMRCVKCPATDEWQLLKECLGCGASDQILSGEEGKFECSYKEKQKEYLEEDIHDYIMDEMGIVELDDYVDKKVRMEFEQLGDTCFRYDPEEVELTDELLDYMIELSETTNELEYRLEADGDDVISKRRGIYYNT